VGEMRVLDATGDTKILWDKDKEDEVETAREMFKSLKKKGYLAFAVGTKGKPGDPVSEFDENLAGLIMQPPVRGG